MNINLEYEVIHVKDYPYKPSSIYPGRSIHASEIEKIAISFNPPVLFLKNYEVIFLSRASITDAYLIAFCENNNIRCVNKKDVWSWILSPYLDGEYTEEDKLNHDKAFEREGLDPTYIEKLRADLKPRMMTYNFGTMLWEYIYLGLADVFKALSGELTPETRNEKLFKQVYWEYCRIANYGREISHDEEWWTPKGSPKPVEIVPAVPSQILYISFALFDFYSKEGNQLKIKLGFSNGNKIEISDCKNIVEGCTLVENYCKKEEIRFARLFYLLYTKEVEENNKEIVKQIEDEVQKRGWRCNCIGGSTNKTEEDFF